MGYLFENAEKMDIQAERKNTKEQRERAEAAEHTLELFIIDLIQNSKTAGHTKEEIQNILQSRYGMKESDAKNKVKTHWN